MPKRPTQVPGTPIRFTARGIADAYDATDKFPGACRQLSNLIFDPSNPELMIARPGVRDVTLFGSNFQSTGVVSVFATIGDRTYGLVGTSRFGGTDVPFIFNHLDNTFVGIGGTIDAAHCPTTQAATGPWTPPTMANVGNFIFVTHPGFAGGSCNLGWFDISNFSAPAWFASDLGSAPLMSKPTAVANFNNRAYFAVGNTTPFADPLSNIRSSISQSLTIGDTTNITALSGLPIQTTSSGVVQALLAFKEFQVWQITGDAALSTLAQNFLSLTVGCPAPRSIAQSPLGVYFKSVDSPMIVDQQGLVRSVTHSAQVSEPDVHSPWENCLVNSRAAGVYTGTIYRLCMQTAVGGVNQINDYWFDEHRRRWTGPHSFSFDCASQYRDKFILSSNALPGRLVSGQLGPNSTSVYLDAGSAFSCSLISSSFPKTEDIEMHQVTESTMEMGCLSAMVFNVTAIDETGTALNQTQLIATRSPLVAQTYSIPWTAPLVFKKMGVSITAPAIKAPAFGTFFAKYKKLGYLNSLIPSVDFLCDGAVFDGSTNVLGKSSALSGVVNSKSGILSLWFFLNGGNGSNMTCFDAAGGLPFLTVLRNNANKFGIQISDAASATLRLSLSTVSTYVAGSGWKNLLCSWDVASGLSHLYIQDASDKAVVVLTDATLAYNIGNWAVGGFSNPATPQFNGALAEVYFAPGQYLDFSDAANRRKFISATGRPVSLGSDGSLPTGTAPAIYLHLYGGELPTTDFAINRGTGGNFVLTGTLQTQIPSPSD